MPAQRYEEVAADLRRRIESGEFPPGAKLPSRAELRVHYQVSDTVADKAMMILRLAGMTEVLPGVGVYVRGSHG
jgi:DNA-binding GntR family transcriptional regulator